VSKIKIFGTLGRACYFNRLTVSQIRVKRGGHIPSQTSNPFRLKTTTYFDALTATDSDRKHTTIYVRVAPK